MDTITQKIIELAQPNFGMQSFMIKISVGIAYEQNRTTGVTALRAQFSFWAKSALKMHCTKMFFRQKLLQITICNFWCKNFFDRPTGVAFALIAQFDFLAKSALEMSCTKFIHQTKVVKIKIHNFYVMQHFSISCTIMEL